MVEGAAVPGVGVPAFPFTIFNAVAIGFFKAVARESAWFGVS